MNQLRRWLAGEQARQSFTFGIAITAALWFGVATGNHPFDNIDSFDSYWRELTVWLAVLFTAASFAYVALTTFAFSGCTGDALAALVQSTSPRDASERRTWRWLGMDEFTNAFSYAVVALGLVVAVLVSPIFDGHTLPTIAVLGTVIGAWAMILLSFAVRYLREWAGDVSAIEFVEHSSEPVAFSDFVWLAAQLSTSYASGHTQLRTRILRRVSTAQAVLAFTFNSTIVVLLVSVALPTLFS